tara:strand:- start:4857 stop:5180 length:324 start_codon:yes stop_codon:yes gene_type:complete
MTKKQTIEQAIIIIAEHFEVNTDVFAKRIIEQQQIRCLRMKKAVYSLTYYMYHGGMSYDKIGRFLGKHNDAIRRYESQGRLMMRGDHAKMIDSLPKIPTTLEIQTVK